MQILTMIKIGVVLAVLAAVGGAYLHYRSVVSERDIALANVQELKTAVAAQQATITAQRGALAEWKAWQGEVEQTLDSMATQQREATAATRRLNDVLSKHDLEALARAKPGLIERRIDAGTADALGVLERITSGDFRDAGAGRPAAGEGAPPEP